MPDAPRAWMTRTSEAYHFERKKLEQMRDDERTLIRVPQEREEGIHFLSTQNMCIRTTCALLAVAKLAGVQIEI